MHIQLKQKLFIYIFMVIMLLLVDIVSSALIFNQFFVKYPLLDISFIMLLMAPIFLFKSHKFSVIYSFIILLLMEIIMSINLTLNYASNDIFSIKYIVLFAEATKVTTTQFLNFWYIAIAVLMGLIFLSYMILVYRLFKYHIPNNNIKKRRYYPLGMTVMGIFVAFGIIFRIIGLNIVKNDYRDSEAYNSMSGTKIIETSSNIFKRGAVKNYGLFTYIGSELTSFIVSNSEKNEVKEYFEKGTIVNQDESDSLSGICKDMNVITIMIETGVDLNINEELTPNLYKLKTEGIDFINNHSKNKTNISEIIGIVGSVAKAGTTKNYNVKSTMPNMLKNEGYESFYFHNNSASFYDRNKLNESMGFTKSYFKDEIDPKENHNFLKGDYPLDSYFMNGLKSGNMNVLSDSLEDIDGIVDKIVPENKKFYSFWTTMSTHGPYNTSKRNMEYYQKLGYVDKIKEAGKNGKWENICKDDNENFQNQIINLQCEMMDLDLAIGTMLDRLEKTNQLDNTLIVLYGDHEPYYMSNNEKPLKFAIYNTDEPFNPNLFKTTLIMYNKKLNDKYQEIYGNKSYDKFSSTYNIVPTILDLLGVKYNSNYYVGKSAFLVNNEFENIFYSHELQSVFTDKLYYFDIGDYGYKDKNIDDNYLKSFEVNANLVVKRIKLFNRFYENKLYDYMK